MSKVTDTPPHRLGENARRDKKPHARVVLVSPTGDRCIIELKPKEMGVQLCHALSRASGKIDKLLTAVELMWGMKYGSLNLDTRWNLFYAQGTFHYLYDNGYFCLLPSLDTMRRYEQVQSDFAVDGIVTYRSRMEELLTADQGPHHTYTLVPLHPDMKKIVIHQQAEGVDTPTAATDFTLAFFPFSPSSIKIKSRLHPKFAILSHGHFLRRIKPADKLEPHLVPHVSLVELALTLYEFWVTPHTEEDPSFRTKIQPRKTKVAKMQEAEKSYSGRLPAAGTSSGVSTRSTSVLSAALGSVASGHTGYHRLLANELDAEGDTEAPNSSFRAAGTLYVDPNIPTPDDMEDIDVPPSPTRDRSVAGGSTRSHATATSKRSRHHY